MIKKICKLSKDELKDVKGGYLLEFLNGNMIVATYWFNNLGSLLSFAHTELGRRGYGWFTVFPTGNREEEIYERYKVWQERYPYDDWDDVRDGTKINPDERYFVK